MLLRTVFTSAFITIVPLSGVVLAEDSVAKMDTSLLRGFSSFGSALRRAQPLAVPPPSTGAENPHVLREAGTTTINGTDPQRPPLHKKNRIRIQLEDTAIYGVFSGGGRPGASDGVVGLGLERPIDRGLALNIELFQPTSRAKRSGSAGNNTKAALKLLFRF